MAYMVCRDTTTPNNNHCSQVDGALASCSAAELRGVRRSDKIYVLCGRSLCELMGVLLAEQGPSFPLSSHTCILMASPLHAFSDNESFRNFKFIMIHMNAVYVHTDTNISSVFSFHPCFFMASSCLIWEH